ALNMSAVDKNGPVANQSNDRREEVEWGKEAVAAAYSKLMEAQEHFRHAAEAAGMDGKHDAEAQRATGKSKATQLCDHANGYLHDKPLVTLGIAFAAGFLVAQLTARKCAGCRVRTSPRAEMSGADPGNRSRCRTS